VPAPTTSDAREKQPSGLAGMMAFALCLCLGILPAGAFVREKTDTTGKDLYWDQMPVHYSVNSACAGPDVATQTCLDAVNRSFSAWDGAVVHPA